MIKFKLKQYSAETEGLDWIGKWKLKKLRKKLAKNLKSLKKSGENLNSGASLVESNKIAQEAAKKTKEEALKKIKEASQKRIKWGKRGAAAGLLIGSGYALKKIIEEPED